MGLENVWFIPPVPKEEMSGAIAAADACVAILKPIEMYKMVYPNKVFDYMAAGRPVILAIDGVIREVVESAEAGIAVPPGDAQSLSEVVRIFYEDRPKMRLMGQNGRRCVEEHFDRSVLAEKLLEIMTKMVEPG
jgi:glycosyltransferase involved in cell wall biosynthesis